MVNVAQTHMHLFVCRLVERLARRGLPLSEQHSRAEELLARLLPGSERTNNLWSTQNHNRDRPESHDIQTPLNNKEQPLISFSESVSSKNRKVTNFGPEPDETRSVSPNDYSSNQLLIGSLPKSHVRAARENLHPRSSSYQRYPTVRHQAREHPAHLHSKQFSHSLRKNNRINEAKPQKNNEVNTRQKDQALEAIFHTTLRSSESPIREEFLRVTQRKNSWNGTRPVSVDIFGASNKHDDISNLTNASLIQFNMNNNMHSTDLESPMSENVREAIRESPVVGESILGSDRIENAKNIRKSDENKESSVKSITKRADNREERLTALRERKRLRDERRKQPKKDRNRNRNRSRNRKRDRNKKRRKKKRGRNKRNKLEELIANESLILHEVDGQPFLDCCPSKLVVVEKQVGKARDKHAVEIHPQSQFFYERICHEDFEGEQCVFPARAIKSWADTRCAQTYSFSQVSIEY